MRKSITMSMKMAESHIGDLMCRCEQLLDEDALRVIISSGETNIGSRLSAKGGAAFIGFTGEYQGKDRMMFGGVLKDPSDGDCSYCIYVAPEETTSEEMGHIAVLIVENIRRLNGLEKVPCRYKVLENTPGNN